MNAKLRDLLADNIPRAVLALVVIAALTACGGRADADNPPAPVAMRE